MEMGKKATNYAMFCEMKFSSAAFTLVFHLILPFRLRFQFTILDGVPDA